MSIKRYVFIDINNGKQKNLHFSCSKFNSVNMTESLLIKRNISKLCFCLDKCKNARRRLYKRTKSTVKKKQKCKN